MKSPNSEQVAVAWLNWLPGLDAPAATRRPANDSSWATTGFVTAAVVGDNALPDVPRSVPIIGVDAWAVSPGSSQPPYEHAAGIAQVIRNAAWWFAVPIRLDVKAGYRRVIVQGVRPISEVRRIAEPEGSPYAHCTLDIELSWVELPD